MENTIVQQNKLMSVEEAIALINKGKSLVLSGEENLLNQLPKGNWIGGTIPYFYLEGEMGRMDKSMIWVTDFTDSITNFKVTTYTEEDLKNVCSNGFENGFNFLILPAMRDIHLSFALNAKNYQDQYKNPLIGLIAGVDLNEFSEGRLSKTFNGQTGESYADTGVALHAALPDGKVARLEIVNVFEQDEQTTIEVQEDGFSFSECLINGVEQNFHDFVVENSIDISLPITLDQGGAIVNISFQRLDEEMKEVVLYAPLFKGEKYTLSKPIGVYAEAFKTKVDEVMADERSILYNCNCILNYVYGELDKNDIGFSGATTFGEIAYTLLNQTFTYLAIDEG